AAFCFANLLRRGAQCSIIKLIKQGIGTARHDRTASPVKKANAEPARRESRRALTKTSKYTPYHHQPSVRRTAHAEQTRNESN
ncbi:MAG: hypothetical protein IJP01_04340, partial [Oscillospiraceae bacterium]|nr:hypothetical protein [Oscillospiraceae bacterium]